MKKPDKFLIVIVLGVITLIAVAFSVALLRPKPTYLPEDSPESIANNYLFALQQDNDERAYGYLSPRLKSYPASVAAFTEDIRRYNWGFRQADRQLPSLSVESVKIDKDHATVTIKKSSFYGGGLFNSSTYHSTFTMQLIRNNSETWKIESSDDYWASCWNHDNGCE